MISRFTSSHRRGEAEVELQNFVLSTKTTTYAFRVMETGQLEHLYYGPKIRIDAASDFAESHTNAHGNSIAYTNDHPEFSLEDMMLETSAVGKGDLREAQFEVICADGSSSLDFVFVSAELLEGKAGYETLPASYADIEDVEHLLILMKDKNHGFELELHYYVFKDCDVIARSARFINASSANVELTRALSMTLDFPDSGYRLTSFHGGWTKEMGRFDTILSAGKFVNDSFTGTSSSRSNPFVMMSDPMAAEDHGLVYGFNLPYSGNHYEAFDVNSFGKTRFVSGINPKNFRFTLKAGEIFELPEAVMTVSKEGMNGMSQNMHDFVREHITRGPWKEKERPVLLNSWEANYFDIDEGKLLKLARKGKEAGVELFVMDDGWFGDRHDDKRALGDWFVNTKKLPGGLKGITDKIHGLGLKFGIWIEPEMINTESELYKLHPDWAMAIPGMDHSEGRNQRVLDFANPEVVDYMIKAMTDVLSSAEIDYVKWDMNRPFSDLYSPYLRKKAEEEMAEAGINPERGARIDYQGEVSHRYVLGLYRLMKVLTETFPNILWEGCAAGGNRFDLGVLSYFQQIWASDNTDAVSRMDIQNGYSYGYPQLVYTSHVSAVPNHQTLRVTPLSTRANVAFFGNLGYECNLCDMSKEENEAIAVQIEIYKKYRQTLQFGRFYRTEQKYASMNRASSVARGLGLTSPAGGQGASDNVITWTIVSRDQKTAVGMIAEKEIHPADPHLTFTARGLDSETRYHFSNIPAKINVKNFGDLINAAGLPIHVKQDSLIHNIIARFYKLEGETEDTTLYGDLLMEAGKPLTQGYIGTGITNVRVFKDFDSRIYFMEAAEEKTRLLSEKKDDQ